MNYNFYVPDTTVESYTIFMLIIPILLIGIFYYIDPFHIKKHYYNAFSILILILLFTLGSLFILKKKLFPNSDSGGGGEAQGLITKLFITLGVFICGFYLGVFIVKKIIGLKNLFGILIFIGISLLIIGSLAILYLVFNKLKNSNNIVMQIIFYIPCLFIEFADYLKEQFNLTTSTVWIILVIEALIVGLLYIIPKLQMHIIDKNSSLLLKEPVYLNKEYSLGDFNELNGDLDKDMYNSKKYSYSISAWYYINPQPPNTSGAYNTWTPIINYSNKPILEYNGKENIIRIKTEVPSNNSGSERNKLEEIYSTSDIDFQKWNNIVFNYDGANIDIFSNGKLVATKPNISPFMYSDILVVGKDDGIHGGVCNVKYYIEPLKKNDILKTYNLLKSFNPPLL